jgi:hypothetical protein
MGDTISLGLGFVSIRRWEMGFSKEDLGGGKHWGRVVNQGWGILASCIGI